MREIGDDVRRPGHRYVFVDDDDRTRLFFQGNDDGQTWYLSRVEISWQQRPPKIIAS